MKEIEIYNTVLVLFQITYRELFTGIGRIIMVKLFMVINEELDNYIMGE